MWPNQEIIWNIKSKLELIVTPVNVGGLTRDFHFYFIYYLNVHNTYILFLYWK